MNTVRTTEFLKKQAEKYGLPLPIIKEIARSQFEFLAGVMRNGDREKLEFKTVMLQNFGKFTATNGTISRINKINETKLKKYGTTELGERKVKRVPGKPEYKGIQ